MFSIGVWDTKGARTGKAARAVTFNRVIMFLLCSCFCFVFSIGVWDMKVARAGKGVKVASLDWFLVHESGQNKQWCVSGGLLRFNSIRSCFRCLVVLHLLLLFRTKWPRLR